MMAASVVSQQLNPSPFSTLTGSGKPVGGVGGFVASAGEPAIFTHYCGRTASFKFADIQALVQTYPRLAPGIEGSFWGRFDLALHTPMDGDLLRLTQQRTQ